MEQDGKSAYTLKPLKLEKVINDPEYTEIDHIIPISISCDDSYNNKVLTMKIENSDKGQRTPIDAYKNHLFDNSEENFYPDLNKYIASVKLSKKYTKIT